MNCLTLNNETRPFLSIQILTFKLKDGVSGFAYELLTPWIKRIGVWFRLRIVQPLNEINVATLECY